MVHGIRVKAIFIGINSMHNFMDSYVMQALDISGYGLIEKQFTEEQCTEILSIANLYGHGYTFFNTARGFNYWMKYRAMNRGWVPPLSLLSHPEGVKEVDDSPFKSRIWRVLREKVNELWNPNYKLFSALR